MKTAEQKKNYKLIKKFPFLEIQGYYPKRLPYKKRYDSTWLDYLPAGWRDVFGLEFCDNLKSILKRGHCLRKFRFLDIKEKYGLLRVEYSAIPSKIADEVYDWENYYEDMSSMVCPNCGQFTSFMTTGWVSYLCWSCAEKKTAKIRLTWKDIPSRTLYRNGTTIKKPSPLTDAMQIIWPEQNEDWPEQNEEEQTNYDTK